MNNLWGKWAIQNMDDDHFYRMSTWARQKDTRLLEHIIQAISGKYAVLSRRLKSINFATYLSMNEHIKI